MLITHVLIKYHWFEVLQQIIIIIPIINQVWFSIFSSFHSFIKWIDNMSCLQLAHNSLFHIIFSLLYGTKTSWFSLLVLKWPFPIIAFYIQSISFIDLIFWFLFISMCCYHIKIHTHTHTRDEKKNEIVWYVCIKCNCLCKTQMVEWRQIKINCLSLEVDDEKKTFIKKEEGK